MDVEGDGTPAGLRALRSKHIVPVSHIIAVSRLGALCQAALGPASGLGPRQAACGRGSGKRPSPGLAQALCPAFPRNGGLLGAHRARPPSADKPCLLAEPHRDAGRGGAWGSVPLVARSYYLIYT